VEHPHDDQRRGCVPAAPGVLLVVEDPVAGADVASWLQWVHAEHMPALLATPATAGAWMNGSTDTWSLHPATQGDPQYTTVIYLRIWRTARGPG
jgi:hypothetical protein